MPRVVPDPFCAVFWARLLLFVFVVVSSLDSGLLGNRLGHLLIRFELDSRSFLAVRLRFCLRVVDVCAPFPVIHFASLPMLPLCALLRVAFVLMFILSFLFLIRWRCE